MDIIEVNDLKIEVPTAWEDVPLHVYEKAHKLRPTTARDLVDAAGTICQMSKDDVDTLMLAPSGVIDLIAERVKFIFEEPGFKAAPGFDLDGVKYVVPIEDELTLGAWVDLDAIQKETDDVISNVLTIVCRPAGEPYDSNIAASRLETFKNLSCDKVLPVLAFFLHYKNVLKKRSDRFSNLAATVHLLPPSIKHLRNPGSGIKLSQIWREIMYYFSIKLLRYRLHKFLRSLPTNGIKTTRKKRKKISLKK